MLGILHLAGAGLLFLASTTSTFTEFFPVILGYTILYMPTLALVNTVSFRQMTNPEKQFPAVRVLAPSDGSSSASSSAGGLGAGGAARPDIQDGRRRLADPGDFSFMLPATPQARRGEKASVRDLLGLGVGDSPATLWAMPPAPPERSGLSR